MSTNSLKDAFNQLRVDLQKNSDKTHDLIEKRETIFWSPTAAIDIESKVNGLLEEHTTRAETKIKAKLAYLSMSTEKKTVTNNLLTETKTIDGINVSLVDIDILVYLFRGAFEPNIKPLAKLLEANNPGLPSSERNKLLSKIDQEISVLEEEKNKLYNQVKEAGLTIKEDYLMDVENIPEENKTVKITTRQADEPVTKLQKMKNSFDIHPNKRIEKRNREYNQ